MIAVYDEFSRSDLEAEYRVAKQTDPELADAIRAVLDTGSPVAWVAPLTFAIPSA